MNYNNLFSAFMMDIGVYIEIVELGMKHGVKPGESMQKEFIEILKKKPEKFTYLGTSDKDVDMLIGNLREEGLKIWNLDEIERRNKQ